MNLENELEAVIHNYSLLGFQNFCHTLCHFITITACWIFLQKLAQQNILQYEGQIFKELVLYLQWFLHTLLLAASLSLKFREVTGSLKMRSDRIVPSNWGNALFGCKPSAADQISSACGELVCYLPFLSSCLSSWACSLKSLRMWRCY